MQHIPMGLHLVSQPGNQVNGLLRAGLLTQAALHAFLLEKAKLVSSITAEDSRNRADGGTGHAESAASRIDVDTTERCSPRQGYQ